MILPKAEEAIHKAWLYRVLTAFADDIALMQYLRFKGGTCAAMLGWLDRFSIDLDFDVLAETAALPEIRKRMEKHFAALGLQIKDQSKVGVQYFLKYDAPIGKRNTIKVEGQFPPPKTNQYAPFAFTDIDRTIIAQTQETMFANKLVAVLDRWEKNHTITGRDIYDIHFFFLQGVRYAPDIIVERRNTTVKQFFHDLIAFMEKHVTTTIITQDLNSLLAPQQFQRVRKMLIPETLTLLRDELQRLEQ